MNDRGSATIWAAWAIAALAALGGLVLTIGSVASARHRANSAADLSALAAAAYGPWGEEHACGLARWVTDRMAVRLVVCQMSGWEAHVEVRAAVSGLGEITARARAGPVGSLGPGGEIRGQVAGSGRPRAVSGITGEPNSVGERYRRPVDVRPEHHLAFARRSLPTSCRQTVTWWPSCAVKSDVGRGRRPVCKEASTQDVGD
jgi:secretion/DNA translocation related TadE-like protein